MSFEPKNLLIVRTDRIGDVILSLPLAALIKKHFKNCKVSFLLREYTKPLVVNHPTLDDIIVLKEKNNNLLLKENIKLIKSCNFDSCIIVYPTFLTALILFLTGINYRIGTGYRWYSFLFNKKVFEHRKYAVKHELEYNVGLLNKIGINEQVSRSQINFDLQVDRNEVKELQSLLKEIGFNSDKKLIVIHPGSGGSAVDLPIDKMKELTGKLSELDDVLIVITGSENELELCAKLEGHASVINLAGKFTLKKLIALISLSDIFISNSTGPMHIAAALGIYTIGFFSKIISCSPQRWGPYTINRTIFTPTIDCKNCTREQCEKLDCMRTIDIGRVFDETVRVLRKSIELE